VFGRRWAGGRRSFEPGGPIVLVLRIHEVTTQSVTPRSNAVCGVCRESVV
jgi:hypothetical protein